MTTAQAIERVDLQIANTCSEEQKRQWLMQLEQVAADTMAPYGVEPAEGETLRIPAPFDDAYGFWLEAKIHYANGEIDRYNNAITLFNNRFLEFRRDLVRKHRPLGMQDFSVRRKKA